MADVDLPVAESAYATLLEARHRPRNIAADLVRPLRTETQNEAGLRRDNQDENPATIRMRMRRCWGDEGRA
jgi:hypothetical protein